MDWYTVLTAKVIRAICSAFQNVLYRLLYASFITVLDYIPYKFNFAIQNICGQLLSHFSGKGILIRPFPFLTLTHTHIGTHTQASNAGVELYRLPAWLAAFLAAIMSTIRAVLRTVLDTPLCCLSLTERHFHFHSHFHLSAPSNTSDTCQKPATVTTIRNCYARDVFNCFEKSFNLWHKVWDVVRGLKSSE